MDKGYSYHPPKRAPNAIVSGIDESIFFPIHQGRQRQSSTEIFQDSRRLPVAVARVTIDKHFRNDRVLIESET